MILLFLMMIIIMKMMIGTTMMVKVMLLTLTLSHFRPLYSFPLLLGFNLDQVLAVTQGHMITL